MATVTIVDPVSRIEGHLKIQVTIDTVNGKQQVTDAQCTGTQFRGF
jgi:hydrogenase large subunit